MKKIYFIRCNKCRKFKNPKISYILNKALVLSVIYDKCDSSDQKYFKKKN